MAEATSDSVRVTKEDKTGKIVRAFATWGGTYMAHVPQMYSLYELYFAAALKRAALARGLAARPNDSVVILVDRRGCSRVAICPGDEAPAIADAGSAWIVASRAKSGPRTTNSLALSRLANAQVQLRTSHLKQAQRAVSRSPVCCNARYATHTWDLTQFFKQAGSLCDLVIVPSLLC